MSCFPFITFKYPGREPLLLEEFLLQRPDLASYYIYDIMLSSGSLLYRSMGGIGATKEKYIVDMHSCIANPHFSAVLMSLYSEVYDKSLSKWRYLRLRSNFNESVRLPLSLPNATKLYLLWASSSYRHKYRGVGYDSIFLPSKLNYELINSATRLSREKNLLFRREDLSSMAESLLHDKVVVYAHLPTNFGAYGCNFLWTKKKLVHTISVIEELASFGHKVCISTTLSKYKLTNQPAIALRGFDTLIVSGFKGSRSVEKSSITEAYFLNF